MAEVANLVFKIVLVLIVGSIIIYEIVRYQEKGVPSNATREEAYRIFQKFKSSRAKVYDEQIFSSYTQNKDQLQRDSIRQKAHLISNLKTKINDTTSKILGQSVSSKKAAVDADECIDMALGELRTFEKEMLSILERCYGNLKSDMDAHLGGVLKSTNAHLDDVTRCISRSLYQCDVVADIDCYGLVQEEIRTVMTDLDSYANEMAATVSGIAEGFRLPCETLIKMNLATYPDTILDYVSSCVSSRTMGRTRSVC